MRNSILVRSIAAVSGIVMLASVAACGDNTASTDSSSNSSTKTEAVSGNFSGAGASSQQAAVEAWIAGFQGTNP
ncbi:MAG TPA: phosphate ABC transporter substrate-binding protein PstS, partial [Bifidobacterium sp.]|nr:phosphate ABC transporter substrate-binding protein PstS [Bifidobacterium sp.]